MFICCHIGEEPSLAYKLDIKVTHLDIPKYLEDLRFDLNIVERLREQTHIILDNSRDAELSILKEKVIEKIQATPCNPGNRKILIFSAFADTAIYLYNNLSDMLLEQGYCYGQWFI